MKYTHSIALAATVCFPLAAMGQTNSDFKHFDASNHPKSQGARLTVTYPASMRAQESVRPRIVQSFVGTVDNVDVVFTLGIEAADDDVEEYCATRTLEDWRQSFQSAGANVLKIQNVTWNKRPAILLMTGAQFTGPYGVQIHARVQIFSICHNRYRISLNCGTSGNSESEVNSLMQKASGTCSRIYGGLAFKK